MVVAPDPHYHLFTDQYVFTDHSAIRDPDGSITICATRPENQPSSFSILNIDPHGHLNWQVDYPVEPSTFVNAIAATPDGGWLVAGSTTMDDATQASDMIVFKLDGTGDLQWTRTYGGAEYEQAYDIIQTSDGNFLIGGLLFGLAESETRLIKIDVNGDTLWTRTYLEAGVTAGCHLLELQNGDILVCEGRDLLLGLIYEAFIRRVTANGAPIWVRSLGSGHAAVDAIEAPNEDILICGGDHPAMVWCLDAAGTTRWESPVHVDGYASTVINSIAFTSDGSLVLCGIATTEQEHSGWRQDDLLLSRLDQLGQVQWTTTTFGDPHPWETGLVLFTEPNDSIIAIGNYYDGGPGGYDVHVVRLGPDGGFE